MSYHYRVGTIVPFAQKYYKQLILAVAAVFMASFAMMSLVTRAETEAFSVEPFEFVGTIENCGVAGTDTVTAAWIDEDGTPAPALKLEKLGAIENCAAAGAELNSALEGQDISQLSQFGFELKDGTYCGAGAPRIRIVVSGTNYPIGCIYGTTSAGSQAGWTHYTFNSTDIFGGVDLPSSGTIDRISILLDEPGTSVLDNLFFNDEVAGEPLVPPTESEVDVYGNVGAENVKGSWLFNRDPRSATPYEFTTSEKTLGEGSLYVKPIANNYAGVDCNTSNADVIANCDKFIAEYFAREAVANFESFSYDFKIAGPAGDPTDANKFYVNIYTTNGDTTVFSTCRLNYVAPSGSITDFTTVNITDETTATSTSGGSGCAGATTLNGLPDNYYIRAIAINLGDTSDSDTGLAGYFDSVVFTTDDAITTFDLEPYPAVTNKEACKNGGWALGLSYENQNAFKNQGDCVSYFATKQKNQPAGSTTTTTNARR